MLDSPNSHGTPAIGGWLLVLCAVLLVWQPVDLALTAPRTLDALPVRGLPLAIVLTAQVLAAGLGIAAGISILQRAGAAVGLARVALTVSVLVDLFVYATPYIPNNRVPGDTPLFAGATVALYATWMLYLWRSKRVRATFTSP